MTSLLVSVRDAEEARQAYLGGATLIDVKEPSRGSLGAADVGQWQAVRQVVPDSIPTSVALGELAEEASDVLHNPAAREALHRYQYAKVGLAACRHNPQWPVLWKALLARLPPHVRRVAVAYADHEVAAAPDPGQVLCEATAAGCHVLLIDTFDKQGGNLFHWLGPRELGELARAARRQRLQLVLAGSLTSDHLARACESRPDYVAVRGAACAGSRAGRLDCGRVRHLVEAVAQHRLTASFRN